MDKDSGLPKGTGFVQFQSRVSNQGAACAYKSLLGDVPAASSSLLPFLCSSNNQAVLVKCLRQAYPQLSLPILPERGKKDCGDDSKLKGRLSLYCSRSDALHWHHFFLHVLQMNSSMKCYMRIAFS